MIEYPFSTPSMDDLRARVRDFAETEVRPRIAEMELRQSVDMDLSRLIAKQGWIGATIPRKFGGMGSGHHAKTIIIEELSRVSGAMGAMVQASQLGVAKILHFGSSAQQRKWLPAIAAGDCLPTIAVTEPESGGHVLGMTATAVRDGKDYILNGSKVHVGNSHVGDLHGVVMRTGPGSKGLSAFLVEADRPGCTLAPLKATMGLHGFSFGEIQFRDCRVPAANLLGNEGDGRDVAYSSSVLYGRPNLAAVALGIHQAVLDDSAAYTDRQTRYGKPLREVATVKQRLGAIAARLHTARLALYHAVSLLDTGQPCDSDLIAAKLTNVESLIDSVRDAMNLHGAAGLYAEARIERYMRDSWHIGPPAGTSDIQRIRVAESVSDADQHEDWSVRFASSVTSARWRSRRKVKSAI